MGELQFGVEVAKQIPSLAVLIWIVAKFLQHMKDIESARNSIDEKRDQHLENLGAGCHAFQERMWTEAKEMFGRTHVALGENRTAFERANDTLLRIERRLEERK